MAVKKGIFVIFRANVISLIFSLCTNFLVPKFLNVEAYAMIKSFQLYVSYIGLFHFGYCDGMYLKYGGKKIEQIDKVEVVKDIATMRVYQILVSFIVMIVAIFIKDFAWFAFSIAIVPLNMVAYYKLLCQATGEFRRYGKITNIITFSSNLTVDFSIFRS